ncbi:MAG: glutamine ABC transporter ATP-binding protein GlnQ [Alphaproteobacteria bacterium]|nr:glutamine ABC transporter ATP-binding protein GlnQ [Alphaproteobacteria bacterium]
MSFLEFSGVAKRFGPVEVLKNINLTVDQKEIVFIIGASGSGKSTLLRCINVLETITEGDLIVDGLSVRGTRRDIRRIRLEAGMVFQQFNLFPHLTALENVMFGPLKVRGSSRGEARDLAEQLLVKVGLGDRMANYPSQLSGGQQQRTAIARALAVKPRMMLFDEPTSALDPELRHEVLGVMRQLADEGMTMIVVTHEMKFARDVGTRLLFLEGGTVLHDGEPKLLLADPPSERLSSFLRHVH